MELSLKKHLLESNVIVENNEWRQHFVAGTKGMPKTDVKILDYAENIYNTVYGAVDYKARLPMALWLIKTIQELGGPEKIGTEDRDKLITILSWVKEVGGEGNIPKMNLQQAYDFAFKGLEKRGKIKATEPEKLKNINVPAFELPLIDAEEEGLAQRLWHSSDGTGRIMVKVNQPKATAFFDKLCTAGKTYGVGCQTTQGGAISTYRAKGTTNLTMLGPPKGQLNGDVSTLFSMALQQGKSIEIKQQGNQTLGAQSFYGYDDLDKIFIEFLGSDVGHNEVKELWQYDFYTHLLSKKIDLLYMLDDLRPDIIDGAINTINKITGGKQWLENRHINSVEIAKNNPEKFLQDLERYSKAKDFNEALKIIAPQIAELAKKFPGLVLGNINMLMDIMPVETFEKLIKNVNLSEFIKNKKDEFEKLIKKMSDVSSKYSGQYRDIMKRIIDENTTTILDSFGGKGVGLFNFLNFLSMPKKQKHIFTKKKNGQIYAEREEVVVLPNGERTSQIVEFPLRDELSIMPKKERREFIFKNKEYIKSFFKGSDKENEIKFLRFVFLETNPQDVERTLKKEKDEFINYYNNNPNIRTKYPGIMEFYAVLNQNRPNSTITVPARAEENERTYFKMDLEDIKNTEYAKKIVSFYYSLSRAETKSKKRFHALRDYLKTLEFSGENPSVIADMLLEKYRPELLLPTADITLSSYEEFFTLLSMFADNKRVIEVINQAKPTIMKFGASAELHYKKLIDKYSTKIYDVDVADMIEFIGDERDVTLTYGKKYSVVEVDYDTEPIKNGRVIVIDDRKKRSDWLSTTEFSVEKKSLYESIKKHIRKKIRQKYNLLKEFENKPYYSAVVLDEKSRKKLLSLIKSPEGWNKIAHHMTIKMGELGEDKFLLGKKFEMKVVEIASDDKVMAVRVETNAPSKNAIKHITIAVNEQGGGKPVMSNNLKNWELLRIPFYVSGEVEEVF